MKKIALINGANLNRLGVREPEIYGHTTLSDVVAQLKAKASKLNAEIEDFQSNSESEIIDHIYALADAGVKFGIINPGAFTHTSVALRDCIAGCGIRFVEVHISNIYKREDFRHTSLTAPVCDGQISGLGIAGYFAALDYLAAL